MKFIALLLFLCISNPSFCESQTSNIAFDGEFDYRTFEDRSELKGTPPGWDNPHNPHNTGDTEVPFDNGIWFLVGSIVVWKLYSTLKKRRSAHD